MSNTHDTSQRTEILIEALPYIQKFRGATFVVKYGGSAMEDEHVVERLLRDIVFLEAVGINPVLVHGGGKAITKKLAEEGVKSRFVNGLRITDASTIGIVRDILDGEVNPRLVETIRKFGGRAKGYSGTTIFQATRLEPQPDDKGKPTEVGFVGDVVQADTSAIEKDIKSETVSVISPLAIEQGTGHILNVNADTAASALAKRLGAAKLIYLSDVPGLMRDPEQPDSLIPSVNRQAVERLERDGVIKGGMLPKVRSALEAIDAGVGKVHFINGRIPHGLLLEVFTNEGVGTEVLA